MKLLNSDIFNSMTALKTLSDIDFPIKVSLEIAKLILKVENSYKVINDIRNKIIGKYGESDKRGNKSVSPSSPNWADFVYDLNELMNSETEVDFEKIEIPTTVNNSQITIKPSTVVVLEKFVTFK